MTPTAFEKWRTQVEPVPLCYRRIKPGQAEPIFIYTPVNGIESGTSGSPVVTADGLLLGVVSHDERMPVCAMALPRWVLDRIEPGG